MDPDSREQDGSGQGMPQAQMPVSAGAPSVESQPAVPDIVSVPAAAAPENTSGQGKTAVVPPEIRGWNWGAFLLNWIWGLGNGTYIALLVFIPAIGFIMSFILGAKGNAWAWQNKKWDSVGEFKRVQRKWTLVGAIIFGVGILAAAAAILLVVFFSAKTTTTASSAQIPMEEFFPAISGNLGLNSVAMPSGYASEKVPADVATSTYLWGSLKDLQAITADPSTVDFTQAKSGVFRVRFSTNVFMENGKLSDLKGPLDVSSLSAENLQTQEGFFHGYAGVPVFAISGTSNGQPFRMAYVDSPADGEVMLVDLQGSGDQAADQKVWDVFLASLDIQPTSSTAAVMPSFDLMGTRYVFGDDLSNPEQNYFEFLPEGQTFDDWQTMVTFTRDKSMPGNATLTDVDTVAEATLKQMRTKGAVVYDSFTTDTSTFKTLADVMVLVFADKNEAEVDLKKVFLNPEQWVEADTYGVNLKGGSPAEVSVKVKAFLKQIKDVEPQFIDAELPEPWNADIVPAPTL